VTLCTYANKSSFDKDKDEEKIHASKEEENDEVKYELDLEGELISALDDLMNAREKNWNNCKCIKKRIHY